MRDFSGPFSAPPGAHCHRCGGILDYYWLQGVQMLCSFCLDETAAGSRTDAPTRSLSGPGPPPVLDPDMVEISLEIYGDDSFRYAQEHSYRPVWPVFDWSF